MAKIMYKYQLEVVDEQEIEMPFGSKIVKVDTQLGMVGMNKYPKDFLQIWCICPIGSTTVKRKFIIIATGSEFNDSGLEFIGTVVFKASNLVYHVFEKL